VLEWANGSDTARLDVDLTEMRAVVTSSGPREGREPAPAWSSMVEA
jgi:hypothetical protein